MNILRCFKIFDEYPAGPKTLFHGVGGSRLLPLDTWLHADEREVSDGTGGTLYLSGFHVFQSLPVAYNYLRRFKYINRKVICVVDVLADELRQKPTAVRGVYLSPRMRIDSREWDLRQPYIFRHSEKAA